MKTLMALVLLVFGVAANACDITGGPGWAFRYSEGQVGGIADVGCIYGEKWDIRAWYVGEQKIYNGQVTLEGYPAISASRIWMFRDGKRVRPIFSIGLLLKESQRCHYNGDEDCNREIPLPFCFLAQAGVKVGDISLTAFHCSNAGLDHGPEAKNLGLDGIRGDVWF